MNAQTSKKRCDKCEALYINGVFCHETGCPNMGKKWVDERWIRFINCFECGTGIEEGYSCDCMVEAA